MQSMRNNAAWHVEYVPPSCSCWAGTAMAVAVTQPCPPVCRQLPFVPSSLCCSVQVEEHTFACMVWYRWYGIARRQWPRSQVVRCRWWVGREIAGDQDSVLQMCCIELHPAAVGQVVRRQAAGLLYVSALIDDCLQDCAELETQMMFCAIFGSSAASPFC